MHSSSKRRGRRIEIIDRNSLKELVTDWGIVLGELHEQFSWPYLESLPASTAKWFHSKSDKENLAWHRRPSIFIHLQQKKLVSRREEELRYRSLFNVRKFQVACIEGQFPEMGLLLASMLLDIDQIVQFISKQQNLFFKWEGCLLYSKKPIYMELLALVSKAIAKEET